MDAHYLKTKGCSIKINFVTLKQIIISHRNLRDLRLKWTLTTLKQRSNSIAKITTQLTIEKDPCDLKTEVYESGQLSHFLIKKTHETSIPRITNRMALVVRRQNGLMHHWNKDRFANRGKFMRFTIKLTHTTWIQKHTSRAEGGGCAIKVNSRDFETKVYTTW